jgi:hypothetical protein
LLVLLDTEDAIKIAPDFVAPEEFVDEGAHAGPGDGRCWSPDLARPDSATVGVAVVGGTTLAEKRLLYG